MKLIMRGIFTWDRAERVTNRYGVVYAGGGDYGVANHPGGYRGVMIDKAALQALDSRRVRLTARVLESRESQHIGDLFLGIRPSRPDVGEVVDLGVGTLIATRNADREIAVGLAPGDGRRELWIDPRKLYRLHEQTVELLAEETSDDFTLASDIHVSEEKGAVGMGDGYIQTKGIPDEEVHTIVAPPVDVESLGRGMFAIRPRGAALSERLEIDPSRKKRT